MEEQNKNTNISTIDQEKKIVPHYHSDGSELIPSEVQANTSFDNSQLLNTPLPRGYTVDDEGITNNYATEPGMSEAEYPSPSQQWRYVFQGAGAILLVAATLLIAFAVR